MSKVPMASVHHPPLVTDKVIPPEPLPSTRGVHRIEQLDSLRGIAALIVFFAHCSFLYPGVTAASAASIKSPLRFLFDGHPAVLFFFLLSGYVLYLPYNRRNVHPRYLPYVVRRICRIYLPYLAGIAFAAIASFLAYRPVPNVGDLFAWHPVSHAALVRNAALFASFILPFDRNIWNGSTWSLAEEMRVSLFFPFLALAVRFFSWRSVLASVPIVSLLCALAVGVTHHFFPFTTVHYAMVFVIGSLLAKHHEAIDRSFANLSATKKVLLAVVALLLMDYGTTLSAFTPPLLSEELSDLLITAGNVIILIAALSAGRFRNILLLAPVQALGRISYSFYLLHLPVLFLSVCLLWTRIGHLPLFAIALVATTLLAMLSYRWIELPCVALGKWLTANMRRV